MDIDKIENSTIKNLESDLTNGIQEDMLFPSNTLGGFIRGRRNAMNFNLTQMAELLKCSVGYLSRIERGTACGPSKTMLMRIADTLKVEYGLLFTMKEDDNQRLVENSPDHSDVALVSANTMPITRRISVNVFEAVVRENAPFPELMKRLDSLILVLGFMPSVVSLRSLIRDFKLENTVE